MAIDTIIKEVKNFHKEELIIIKLGDFYHCYGKDAYIISYLFGYKLAKTKEGYYMCGFPLKCIAKVENKLQNKKINYMILDRKNNYDVDVFENYKKLNNYMDLYEKAKKHINTQIAIDKIYKDLIKNMNNTEINKKIYQIQKILEGNI